MFDIETINLYFLRSLLFQSESMIKIQVSFSGAMSCLEADLWKWQAF